ncbi:MAG: AMP-binding protein, partial [Gammaproteobacteria bacterium]
MSNDNLYLRFSGTGFAHAGERPFLNAPGREPLMYADLDAASGRMHNRLVALGVEPGDRVMVQVGKSAEAVVLYLACLRAGAIYIPLNTAYTPAEVEYFMGDAEPRVFVCQASAHEALAEVGAQVGVPHVLTLELDGSGSLMDGVDTLDASPGVVPRDGDDLAAILYTSGTTGRSKGAMLSHDNLRTNAEVLHEAWHWDDANDVLLHALPIFHVHGLFVALHCALLGGSPVHFLPRFDTASVIEHLPGCTVMMGVPTFYTRLLDTPEFNAEVCRNMRLFTAGSA